jgi:putative addiction module component (TIGR02574 family)
MEQIFGLSVAERVQLAEDIWDSLVASQENIPVTDAQREELDRRLEAHAHDPSAALPWDEVRGRLKKSR